MIGTIIISNRPKSLEEFCKTLPVLGSVRDKIKLCALIQQPFTGNEPFLECFDRVELIHAIPPPTPFAYFRKRAMSLAKDCDWFWSLDDDHRFKDGKGEMFNKTCEQYYLEVFDWLDQHPEVGALSCRGYVGGYSWGYDFKINPDNGLVATDKGGIFLRNIGIDKIVETEEEVLVGALFESLAIYNIMSYNYSLGRRYNSPISNKPPGQGKHIGGSKNVSYSDEIVNENIQGRIRKKFNDPLWTHSSKKYPYEIRRMIGKP